MTNQPALSIHTSICLSIHPSIGQAILFLFLFGVYGWLLHYCCRPPARNLAFSENNINIERQLLLNELSICPQFELIFKSTVCSLKWAHVEVLSSVCLRDASSLSCKGLSHFSENNELSKWPKLILRFKELCLFFIMSPSWVHLLIMLKRCLLSK